MAEDTPISPDADDVQDNLPKNEVQVQDAGTLKKKVTVTIPRERIDAKYDEMYGELSETVQIPGFRIGRAPRRLVEKRFGKEIGDDVRNGLIGEALSEAIDDAELNTLGEPDLKLEEIELPEEGDLSFDFEVEVAPEFDTPEVEGIEVNREKFEVDDARVDEYIENFRQQRARYEKTDQKAEEGDSVITAAKLTGEGVEKENPRVPLRVAPGVIEGIAVADLGEKLKDVKPGDTVTFEAEVPDTHPTEDWQGKTLTIELTVHEVSRRVLPEIDEDFAKTAGFESLQEFRDFIAENLKDRVEYEQQQSMRNQICEYLLDKAEFELPEGVVKRHTGSMMQRQFVQLLQSGVPREKIEENLATLQSAAEEQARRDLKLSFILGKLAEEKGIEVTEMEINSRIAQMASQYGRRPERMRQELASDGSLQTLAASIQEEKVLDSLLENAKVVDVDPADADAKAEKKSEKKATKKAAKKAAKKSSKKSSKDNAAKDDEE